MPALADGQRSHGSTGSGDALGQLHGSLTRALDGTLTGETARQVSEAACGRLNEASGEEVSLWETSCRIDAESRALACFCTHAGIACSKCQVKSIQGPRYRCTTSRSTMNLCERCRRSVGGDAADGRLFMVFDHPWEASEEYMECCTSDCLQVPAPPLMMGDVGPRVMHLHYVLYRVGYLSLSNPWFTPGMYCGSTREAIGKFQTDHRVVQNGPDQIGVYTALTRSVLLSLFDELESRCARSRYVNVPGAESTRMRTALAA